jgi:hypothetical protein
LRAKPLVTVSLKALGHQGPGRPHRRAVRISGGDPERLGLAAEPAAEVGLEAWFAPFPCELTAGEMLELYDCAERDSAHDLELASYDVVKILADTPSPAAWPWNPKQP